jgi:TolB-like protein/Tfp pilus assembly protein PilF
MGEVYRARDAGLEREIAIKVLPADTLTDENARARMLREARMAARLNHPHVCTVHEVGEAEGRVYIAMELVEGRSLAAVLADGAIPVEQAVRYGAQVAGALAHAHGRGVVHRDLKSANVVVTPEGLVKVLDFGLAKPLIGDEPSEAPTESGASLTAAGTLVGTVAYMAPEQLRGQAADARSDIWALGVVLYEMLGGRRPFAGQTGYELSSAILNEPPPALPAGVPAPLRAVTQRCLAKARGERYQRAEEVRAALETVQSGGVVTFPTPRTFRLTGRRWSLAAAAALAILAVLAALDVGGVRRLLLRRGTGDPKVVRMAVLPFVNLTGDPEQEYLSDGITQEMITELGRLHPEGLSVIARSSVMRYKGGDTPVDQIGRELRVSYVLEGSARREANRVRITAELIHVGDQTQLWADSYERELEGILAVQAEVARQVASALALELLPDEQARLTSARAVDPEAYDAFLKGSYHWKKLTPEGLDTAERYFELALEEDPSYAPAHAGLAWVWSDRQQMGITPPHQAGPKVKTAALRAIELDESSAEAHEALALAKTWTDWDWAGAEVEWRRALELDPSIANAHAFYAHFLAITARTDEAVRHGERAIELDPFNALFHGLYAIVLNFDRRYDDALAAARTGFASQPGEPISRDAQQYAYIGNGMRDEWLAEQRKRISHDPEQVAAFEQGLAAGGYEGAQRAIADLLAERYETSSGVPTPGGGRVFPKPKFIAQRYLDAGDHNLAIDWLEQAYQDRDPSLPYITMPFWDPLRPDRRFQDLLRRMNLPTD